MLYWGGGLAVVCGCQAPKGISAKAGGARKRARLGFIERSCTSGLYSGSELRPMLRRVKHVEGRDERSAGEKRKGWRDCFNARVNCVSADNPAITVIWLLKLNRLCFNMNLAY